MDAAPPVVPPEGSPEGGTTEETLRGMADAARGFFDTDANIRCFWAQQDRELRAAWGEQYDLTAVE
jgi:hypothetical protein